jgi:hypothetical protein
VAGRHPPAEYPRQEFLKVPLLPNIQNCYWLLSYPAGQNRDQGGRKRIDPAVGNKTNHVSVEPGRSGHYEISVQLINGKKKKKIAVRLAVPEAEQASSRGWRGVAAAVNPCDGGRTIG